VFGAVYVDLAERWTLSLESRLQRDRIRDENRLSRVVLTETFDSFTPRVILDFRPDDDAMYYVSAARGVRPGAFNANLLNFPAATQAQIAQLSGATLAVDQEELDMYELGAKLRLFDRRLLLTSALYYGDWTNQHVSSTVPVVNPTTGQTTLVNVVSAIGQTALSGLELEASLRATDHLSLQLGFALNDTDIRQFVCSQCQSTITGSGNVRGNRLANTPRTNGALGVTYERPVLGEWNGFTRVDYLYRGSQYATEANLARIGAAHTVNLRIGAESSALRVEAFVTNLFDDDTYKTASYTPNLANLTFGNALAVAPAERRSYGVRARYAF
jgi:iron complex outermembrane recepter protein